ncbi:MAG: molybdenum cofactor guanylyltransferase [Anaerolineales bacterium]
MLEHLSLAIIADHYPTRDTTPRSLAVAQQYGIPVNIISNFPGTYAHLTLSVNQDIVLNKGILGSLYTALFTSPRRHVLVLTPDMHMPNIEMVTELSSVAQQYDSVVAALPTLQPIGFGAVYSKMCLGTLWQQLERGQLAVEDFYAQINVYRYSATKSCSIHP